MKRQTPIPAFTLFLLMLPAALAGAQAPVSLGPWTAESYPAVSGFGAGIWTVAPGGSSVTQSVNGQPTLFYSDFGAFNQQVEGQLVVNGSDDDYVGFALGFDPGDSMNPAADYLLVDWKRGNQNFNFGTPSCTPGALAVGGLAVSRVTGIPTADEFWGHVNLNTVPCSGPGDGLVELARGLNLGSTGWVLGTSYTFQFDFTATSLRVYVDNVLEIDISGIFSAGRLAFYNFSQAGVTYSAFTTQCPATFSNYLAGYPGTLGIPTLSLSAPPVIGTTVSIIISNVAGSPALAYGVIGTAPASIPTPLGGSLLVTPAVIGQLILPEGVSVFPWPIPGDPALCGVSVYLQIAHVDGGSTFGFAFSPGLEVVFGT